MSEKGDALKIHVGFLLIAFIVVDAWGTLSPALAETRPNILLIVSEDNGPELGCYGDPYSRTPVLDGLAAKGCRFQNAYVPQAGCSQSRAAFLTGLYPHQNGQIGLATWKFRMYRPETPNLVRSLKQAGYRTGIIGKLHVNPSSAFPFDMTAVPSANFNRKKLDEYAQRAAQFFVAGDEPFFLSVNFPDAHRPFLDQVDGVPRTPLTADEVKPLSYFGIDTPELRAQTAAYYNCMARLDALVGDLLESLEESSKLQDTLVIYIGDHGADLLRGKRTSYEGGLRIPMIMHWPGRIQGGMVHNELVSTIDLMPTLLEFGDAAPVDGLPGRSLGPLLENTATVWREYLFSEYHLHSAHNFYPQRSVRNQRYKLIHNLLAGQINPGYDFTINRFFDGLRARIEAAPDDVRGAYERMRVPPPFELYDLVTDPNELDNLAENQDYAPILAELKSQLDAWRRETADPLLDDQNLKRLKREIEGCFVDGSPQKSLLHLHYPEYFFSKAAAR